jgi:type VI secretion system secreted protein Hcp
MKTKHTKKVIRVALLVLAALILYSLSVGSGSVEATSLNPDGFPSTVNIATDMFLQIDGIDGESTDDRHRDWIEIVSFDSKVSIVEGTTTSREGAYTGSRPQFSELTVGKVIDKATPNLYLHCCSGRHISQVVIEFCRATGEKQVYMKYTLTDVIVSSVGPVTVAPTSQLEQVSFRFARIDWEYTPTDATGRPGGAVRAGWDLLTNTER